MHKLFLYSADVKVLEEIIRYIGKCLKVFPSNWDLFEKDADIASVDSKKVDLNQIDAMAVHIFQHSSLYGTPDEIDEPQLSFLYAEFDEAKCGKVDIGLIQSIVSRFPVIWVVPRTSMIISNIFSTYRREGQDFVLTDFPAHVTYKRNDSFGGEVFGTFCVERKTDGQSEIVSLEITATTMLRPNEVPIKLADLAKRRHELANFTPKPHMFEACRLYMA